MTVDKEIKEIRDFSADTIKFSLNSLISLNSLNSLNTPNSLISKKIILYFLKKLIISKKYIYLCSDTTPTKACINIFSRYFFNGSFIPKLSNFEFTKRPAIKIVYAWNVYCIPQCMLLAWAFVLLIFVNR